MSTPTVLLRDLGLEIPLRPTQGNSASPHLAATTAELGLSLWDALVIILASPVSAVWRSRRTIYAFLVNSSSNQTLPPEQEFDEDPVDLAVFLRELSEVSPSTPDPDSIPTSPPVPSSNAQLAPPTSPAPQFPQPGPGHPH
jgi:hypothetical protein